MPAPRARLSFVAVLPILRYPYRQENDATTSTVRTCLAKSWQGQWVTFVDRVRLHLYNFFPSFTRWCIFASFYRRLICENLHISPVDTFRMLYKYGCRCKRSSRIITYNYIFACILLEKNFFPLPLPPPCAAPTEQRRTDAIILFWGNFCPPIGFNQRDELASSDVYITAYLYPLDSGVRGREWRIRNNYVIFETVILRLKVRCFVDFNSYSDCYENVHIYYVII